MQPGYVALWPYESSGRPLDVDTISDHLRFVGITGLCCRTRKAFGVPVEEKGIPW